jgi:hypothetical protein
VRDAYVARSEHGNVPISTLVLTARATCCVVAPTTAKGNS